MELEEMISDSIFAIKLIDINMSIAIVHHLILNRSPTVSHMVQFWAHFCLLYINDIASAPCVLFKNLIRRWRIILQR